MLTTVAAGRVFDYSYCLGMYGMSGQGFWTPQDMALAPASNGDTGIVYVINRGAEELGQRISRVTLDHQFLGQFGAFGRGDGQFVWPRAIALDGDNNVFATDDFLNRVSVFDAEGAFISSWGEAGSGEGQLKGAAGIAFDADGNVVVVDSMNHRVQRFNPRRRVPRRIRQPRQRRRAVRYALGPVHRRRRRNLRGGLAQQASAEVRRRRQPAAQV